MDEKNYKLYYSVKEVADIIGEDIATIYYWAKVYNLKLPTSKISSSKKRFRQKDIEQIQKIKHLVRDKKLTSDGVKAILSLDEEDDTLSKKAKALALLKKSLLTLDEMIRQMDSHRLKSQKEKLKAQVPTLFPLDEEDK